jgi:hypothetical protein
MKSFRGPGLWSAAASGRSTGSIVALHELRVELFVVKTLAMIERDALQSGRFAQLEKKLAKDQRVPL